MQIFHFVFCILHFELDVRFYTMDRYNYNTHVPQSQDKHTCMGHPYETFLKESVPRYEPLAGKLLGRCSY